MGLYELEEAMLTLISNIFVCFFAVYQLFSSFSNIWVEAETPFQHEYSNFQANCHLRSDSEDFERVNATVYSSSVVFESQPVLSKAAAFEYTFFSPNTDCIIVIHAVSFRELEFGREISYSTDFQNVETEWPNSVGALGAELLKQAKQICLMSSNYSEQLNGIVDVRCTRRNFLLLADQVTYLVFFDEHFAPNSQLGVLFFNGSIVGFHTYRNGLSFGLKLADEMEN